MKAILCEQLGGPDDLILAEVDDPRPGPGELLVKVAAAGVNFADTLQLQGRYQIKAEPPFTPGLELCGTVLEVGEGCSRFRPGERVMAAVPQGAYAEKALVSESIAWTVPDTLSDVQAAGFPIIYGTSHASLWGIAGLKEGESLLVLGAAGGVGLTAVEIGAKLGATVIAAAGGPEKLEICAKHGAHHGIDYREEDIKARVKELTGNKGVDVIYDAVGGASFDAGLRATAQGARVLIIGFASGDIPQIPANYLMVKNIQVFGVNWGALSEVNPSLYRASCDHLSDMAARGQIEPPVSETMPLDQVPEALRLIKARKTTGKVVITMS
ncbi:MAG: NADPH:quinone oxidoreductase family protein [Magnetovibrionaceae bacterium]